MFIKLNKNTLHVNFNKHKLNYVICDIKDFLTTNKQRICNYTNYTHRGRTFTFITKQPYLSFYWQKYNMKIFNQKIIQKEKYEMKGETIIKKRICN